MKESILNSYKAFQISDFDNDLIGICKALVDFIKTIRTELGSEPLPAAEKIEGFYKLDPHFPRMELRENLRNTFYYAMYHQDTEDEIVKLSNIFMVVLSSCYVYHLPLDKVIEEGLKNNEFTREESKRILLEDNMSPNWIKEPSGTDYSGAIR